MVCHTGHVQSLVKGRAPEFGEAIQILLNWDRVTEFRDRLTECRMSAEFRMRRLSPRPRIPNTRLTAGPI